MGTGTLKIVRGRKLGQFWLTTADAMFKAFSKGGNNVLAFDGRGPHRVQ